MASDFPSDCGFFADAIETVSNWPYVRSGAGYQSGLKVADTRNNLESVTRDLRAAEDYFESTEEDGYDRFFESPRETDSATVEFFRVLSYVGILVVGISQEAHQTNTKRLQYVVGWYRGVVKDAGADGERYGRAIERFTTTQKQLVASLRAIVSHVSNHISRDVEDSHIQSVFHVAGATMAATSRTVTRASE